MPDNVYTWAPSCPGNTPVTAPVEFALVGMDPIVPRKVTVTIPDGHSGLTGIAVAFGHNAVIPANTGAFISGNDWTFPFELTSYPNGVSWSVLMCNLDLIPHVWQVIFEGDNLPLSSAAQIPAAPSADDIMVAATAALGGP